MLNKKRIRYFLVALALTFFFAGWRFYVLLGENRFVYLQIRMMSSTDGIAQLYYDTGAGLSEDASVRMEVAADEHFRQYRFRLPREAIRFFRFDPLMSDGKVSIKDMAVVDGFGRTLFPIDLQWVRPGQQIKSLDVVDGVLTAVMGTGAADPQLAVVLPTFFRPETASSDIWLILGWRVLSRTAAFFVIVSVLLYALQWFVGKGRTQDRPAGIPAALVLALLTIGAVEAVQQTRLPAKAFYHEVDELLYRLEHVRFNADGIILGNSVAYQVFTDSSFLERGNVAMLATNEAIGMTGQYFITKRYLEKNRLPEVVILLTLPRLEGSLSDEKADNYICRTFTRPSEILDVLRLKRDPAFTLKMILYRLCASFKYRLQLQKEWMGFTNAPIYTGAAHAGRSAQSKTYAITQILQDRLTCTDIPRRHLIRLLDLLEAHDIPLYFLTPPLKEGNRSLQLAYRHVCSKLFPALRKDHSLLCWSHDEVLYPDRFFTDDVHFSEEGLRFARPYLYGLVDRIMRSGKEICTPKVR